VLLTGASRGLGRYLAKRLASLGCRLICWDIDESGLNSLKKKLGPSVLHVFQVVDVADAAEINEAFEKSPVRSVDIVIANAGVVNGKSISHLDLEQYERTIHVNLFQHFHLFKLLQPTWNTPPSESSSLPSSPISASTEPHTSTKSRTTASSPSKANKAAITSSTLPPTFVMISSVCGLMALTQLSDYCASKFGVVGLAEGMRLDLRRERSPINTLLVMPFLINTKMFSGISVRAPASWFLSPLDKSQVAERIIEGIRSKRQWLVLPWILHFAPLLLLLPISIRNILYDLIGESTYMDAFKGNRKTPTEARRMDSILSAPLPESRLKLKRKW